MDIEHEAVYYETEIPKPIKYCQKGPWHVYVGVNITSGTVLSGVAFLPSGGTISQITAMKLGALSISTASGATINGGFRLGIFSTTLSSNLLRPPYIVGTATNTGNVTCLQNTALIGTADILNSSALSTNYRTQSMPEGLNGLLRFQSPMVIDRFDWSIASLIGNFSFSQAYTIEFELLFYDDCSCSHMG